MDKKLSARQLERQKNKFINEANKQLLQGKITPEKKAAIEKSIKDIDVEIANRIKEERLASEHKVIKNMTEHIKDEPVKLKTKAEYMADVDAKRAALKKMRSKQPSINPKTRRLMGKLGKGLKKGLPALGAIMAGVNILGAPEAQAGEVAMEEASNLLPGGIDKLGAEKGSDEYNVEDSGIDTNTVGMTKELADKVMNKRREEAREKRRLALEALRKRSGME